MHVVPGRHVNIISGAIKKGFTVSDGHAAPPLKEVDARYHKSTGYPTMQAEATGSKFESLFGCLEE